MNILYTEECLEYAQPGHPESPERVQAACEHVRKLGAKFISPPRCREQDILKVHSAAMLKAVKAGTFYDPDTPVLPRIFEYAMLSAGSAIQACKSALEGVPSFSLMRPPGHHATRSSPGGFCYFNNIAIAVAHALPKIKKAAIVDIDCHHGNGTEDIFSGNSGVLFISLHQSPLYPGTGLSSTKNCINYPLPAGTGEKDYLKTLDAALEKVRSFKPSLVAVSAGFDTHRDDPITGMALETGTYQSIAARIRDIAPQYFAVLEGGYGEKFGECVASFVKGLA